MDEDQTTKLPPDDKPSLVTISLIFLRLGATAFGGPAAHIAMMEDQFVRQRNWLSREEFLDLLGMTNLIPGPNSTEMAIHIGYKQAGWPGLLTAGICFILPAALMVYLIAALYLKFGQMPQSAAIFYGIKPVVIAIIVQAIWRLLPTALKNKSLCLGALGVGVLSALGINEIALLFGSGLIASMIQFCIQRGKEPRIMLILTSICGMLIGCSLLPGSYTLNHLPFSLSALFLYFLKIGSILYGSGYVLLAFLRSDLVSNYHWITSAQLLDATAVGQMTPGPVFTTATFIGYIIGGPLGAFLSTLGIFLPAFIFVALSGKLVRQMRQSSITGVFLDAINAAALALMVVVTIQLARAAIIDFSTLIITLVSAFLLVKTRINSVWLILGGAICGLLSSTGHL